MSDFWLTSTTSRAGEDAPANRTYVRQYGSGHAILIAVHGFGRNGKRMERLGLHLGNTFTMLAPDLPFHGQSEWYSDRYDMNDLAEIFQQLIDRYPDRPVFLLGHSLGGRYLSACLGKLKADRIQDMALVAPDGAGGKYTNWIDTLPSVMVKPLARITERPKNLLRLSRWLRARGIINRYSAEYLKYNLNDRPFRRRIAGTLRSVLKFPPRPAKFEQALREKEIKCVVFVGDTDPLIHHERLAGMYDGLPSVQLQPYRGSHWLPEQLLAEYYQNKALALS